MKRRELVVLLRASAAMLLCVGFVLLAAAEPRADEPVTPVEPDKSLNVAKIQLGGRLFRDKRLSHENTVSCATCHQAEFGGGDGRKFSMGADGRPLEFNTPTIFNAARNFRLNWRGTFRTLEQQNEAVLLNTQIMNTTWEEVLPKLGGDRSYLRDFTLLYGSAPTPAYVLDALATFQRSLVTPNSRFDRRLRGDQSAISPDEEQGYQLFKSNGCVACHQGANFGGNLLQRMGIFNDPFRQPDDVGRNTAERPAIPSDKERFRVPSLRNVAVTGPYFHNGYTFSLSEAVEIMARSQLGRDLPKEDVRLIVKFLHTLTGEYQGRPVDSPGGEPR